MPDKQPQPNILIILADDHGYGDISLHQGPHLSSRVALSPRPVSPCRRHPSRPSGERPYPPGC